MNRMNLGKLPDSTRGCSGVQGAVVTKPYTRRRRFTLRGLAPDFDAIVACSLRSFLRLGAVEVKL